MNIGRGLQGSTTNYIDNTLERLTIIAHIELKHRLIDVFDGKMSHEALLERLCRRPTHCKCTLSETPCLNVGTFIAHALRNISCFDRVTLSWIYRQTSNIRGTKSQNLNVSRFSWQLSLRNLLKPGVKSFTECRQAMLQLYLSNKHF